jgi:hypothetical protein
LGYCCAGIGCDVWFLDVEKGFVRDTFGHWACTV